jgi:hypothetical protein
LTISKLNQRTTKPKKFAKKLKTKLSNKTVSTIVEREREKGILTIHIFSNMKSHWGEGNNNKRKIDQNFVDFHFG